MTFEFNFDQRKTAQAAAYLLSRGGGNMEYLKLMKLLYLADRKAFLETGAPITGDRWVAMKRGPVLSRTLNQIKSEGTESSWDALIETQPTAYKVSLKNLPDALDELSEIDIEILDSVYSEFGSWGQWKLVKFTHDLPEWIDPGGSASDIDPKLILRNAGWSDDEISELVRAHRDVRLAWRRT
jgi:uncharacterized phage-associated protein